MLYSEEDIDKHIELRFQFPTTKKNWSPGEQWADLQPIEPQVQL